MSQEIIPAGSSPALISKARALLAKAETLDQVMNVRALAKAGEEYFRDFKTAIYSRKLAKEAAEIRLRAERKAGQILRQMAERGERAGRGGDDNHRAMLQTATLPDLGIERTQSHRWQEIGVIAEPLFEAYIAEAHAKETHEMTTSGLRTLAKFDRKREQAEEISEEPEPLPRGPFRVIVVDPPWPYALRRPTVNDSRGYPEYAAMTLEEIQALPIAESATEDAVLWLWTTNAFLEEAFVICRNWGFQYRTLLTWGKNKIGLGDWLRGQTEHCLMASRGSPAVNLSNQSTLLRADVREHSRKPDEFYALVESLCPAPKRGRLDVFAREPREGWRVWGHEAKP
jgi:N6-adenosine-specific RNA methylase IME4